MSAPKCLQCKHYYATFDAHNPRGCRVYGFKSSTIPSYVVKRETGSDCLAFEPRPQFDEKRGDKPLDLNDPRLWGDK